MSKLNILYAEDDKTGSEVLVDILKNFQMINRIDVALDGKRALDLFNKNKDYDVLITDLRMPKIDGIELIENIIKSKKIHTIITTAFEEIDYLKKAIELGVNKFITKPLDISQIVNNLQEYYEEKIKQIEYEHQKSVLEINSKLITMGEMIDSIVHQWSQPLSVISMENSANEYLLKASGFKDKYIYNSMQNIDLNVRHLHETLSDFRTFARPDLQKEHFWVSKSIDKALKIVSYPIKNNNINVKINLKEDFELDGFSNQFSHIIINLINNSKDAFKDNNISDRQINIKLKNEEIIFSDNAGGISEHIINQIFEPNITSKDYGTGIGMYMSKKIAFNNGCKISVKNTKIGAEFKINKI